MAIIPAELDTVLCVIFFPSQYFFKQKFLLNFPIFIAKDLLTWVHSNFCVKDYITLTVPWKKIAVFNTLVLEKRIEIGLTDHHK